MVLLDHRLWLRFLAQASHLFLCALPTFLSPSARQQLALAARRKLCAYTLCSSQLLRLVRPGASLYSQPADLMLPAPLDTHQYRAVNWCQRWQSAGLNWAPISITNKGFPCPGLDGWNRIHVFSDTLMLLSAVFSAELFHMLELFWIQMSVQINLVWFLHCSSFFLGEDLKPGKTMAGGLPKKVKKK